MATLRLRREKLDAKKWHDQGYQLFDMHLHTKFSNDAFSSVNRVLKLAKRKGIGLAISDHNEIRGSVIAAKNKMGVPIIPGIELKFQRNLDILCYFYSVEDLQNFFRKYVEPHLKTPFAPTNIRFIDMAPEYFFSQIHDINYVVSIAHPFVFRAGAAVLIKEKFISAHLLDYATMVEIMNGHMTKGTNLKAARWKLASHKNASGGSDSHMGINVGRMVTATKVMDAEHFLDAVKRESIAIGKEPFYMNTIVSFAIGLLKIIILHFKDLIFKSSRKKDV
ncbi:MAG: PHP domain-containing protein [bacterium]